MSKKTGSGRRFMIAKNLIMMLATLAAILVAIFAWFSQNTTATASGITMTTKTPDKIELAVPEKVEIDGKLVDSFPLDNLEWKPELDFSLSGYLKNMVKDITSNGKQFAVPNFAAANNLAEGRRVIADDVWVMNYNSAPAFVNLYLKDFSNNPNNYIGTIAPSLTHKGLSSTVHLKNRNQVRVYCQFDAANDWKESGAAHYVVYKAKGDDAYHYRQITRSTPTQASNSKTTYYADLPDHTTEFFFATDGSKEGFVGSNSEFTSVTNPWFRSNTITNIQPGVCYRLTGASDDTTWYAAHTTIDVPNGISVMTSFDTLTISGGQSAYVTLTGGTNFSGVSASYACTGDNLSVNANTGYVTAAAGFSSGTITTTITGGLGDTTTFVTQVSNPPELKSATVAMNVEVPGATPDPDDERKTIPGKTEIVWYIANEQAANDGDSAGFTAIYYTK